MQVEGSVTVPTQSAQPVPSKYSLYKSFVVQASHSVSLIRSPMQSVHSVPLKYSPSPQGIHVVKSSLTVPMQSMHAVGSSGSGI